MPPKAAAKKEEKKPKKEEVAPPAAGGSARAAPAGKTDAVDPSDGSFGSLLSHDIAGEHLQRQHLRLTKLLLYCASFIVHCAQLLCCDMKNLLAVFCFCFCFDPPSASD